MLCNVLVFTVKLQKTACLMMHHHNSLINDAEFKYIYGTIYVGSCFDTWFSFLKYYQENGN